MTREWMTEDVPEIEQIQQLTDIISLQNASQTASGLFLDDPNLTESYQLSNLKQEMTKYVNVDLQNLTQNIPDHKSSNLSVPISVTALLRFAIKNDLAYDDDEKEYSFDKIMTTLTMIVYPRSMAGLNLNPKEKEKDYQMNHVETLIERICQKTFLSESGWEIIRRHNKYGFNPAKSVCEYKKGKQLFKIRKNSHFK